MSGIGDGIFAHTANGAIDITTAAVTSTSANGIEAQTGTGAITIVTKGAVTGDTAAGFAGVLVDAGDINMTFGGPVTGGIGVDAIATNPVGSSVTINSTAGLVTGTAGQGILAQTANGFISLTTGAVTGTTSGIEADSGTTAGATLNGAITIVTAGNVNGGSALGDIGILAKQELVGAPSGNISIATGGEVIAGTGIAANAQSGSTIIMNTTAGTVTGLAGDGIDATGVIGAIGITTAAVNGAVNGISAATTGGGAVSVQVASGYAITGGTGIGINATQAGGNGNVAVTTGGAVTAATGVNASVAGNGAIALNTTAGLVTGTKFDAIDATAANGATSITTGAVTGAVNGVNASSSGGPITVATDGQVNAGSGVGIIADQAGAGTAAIGNVLVTSNSTVIGASGINASANGTGEVAVTTAAGAIGDVTGTAGSGISAAAVNGAVTVNANAAQITAAGSGNSGISATSAGSGTATINVSSATLVTGGTTATGITLNTAGGSANGFLYNDGQVTGAGTSTNPVVVIGNNNTGILTLDNAAGAFIGNTLLPNASVSAQAIITSTFNALGATIINNAGTVIGDVSLNSATNGNTFNILPGGVWAFTGTSSLGAGVGPNTLDNQSSNSVWIYGPTATINGLQDLLNTGSIYVGNSPCASPASSCGAISGVPGSVVSFNASSGAVQTVINGSVIAVNGQASFNGAAGSSFLNESGGIIDMSLFRTGTLATEPNPAIDIPPVGGITAFPQSTHATTDYVALNATTTGTSDLNYTYTFGPAYNWTGAGTNWLYLDTNIGAPGAASDRLIVSGTATGQTNIAVWDTSTIAGGAYNPTGITLAAVNGPSLNAFFLAGQTNPLHDSPGPYFDEYEPGVGPMGAINKGLFTDYLLQAPLQPAGSAAGSRYALFGLPNLPAIQLPVVTTAAQTIFNVTALDWLDREDELRNWMRWSKCTYASSEGGGADLLVKSSQAQAAPTCQPGGPGFWFKTTGSIANRTDSYNVASLLPFPAPGLPVYDLSYNQTVFSAYGGVDFGQQAIFKPYDVWVGSVMLGYVDSNLNFNSGNAALHYTGATAGLTGTYLNNGFFADGLIKSDILQLNSSYPTLSQFGISLPSQQVYNVGGVANIGYRWDYTRLFYIEPIGTLSYVATFINNINSPGLSVQYNTGEDLRGGIGARLGVNWLDSPFYQVDSSFTGKVWDQFVDRTGVTFLDTNLDPNATPLTLSDMLPHMYGEVVMSTNIVNKGIGWSGFANAGMQFSSQFTIFTGKGGVRYQW